MEKIETENQRFARELREIMAAQQAEDDALVADIDAARAARLAKIDAESQWDDLDDQRIPYDEEDEDPSRDSMTLRVYPDETLAEARARSGFAPHAATDDLIAAAAEDDAIEAAADAHVRGTGDEMRSLGIDPEPGCGRGRGRPRKHASDADRKRAYEDALAADGVVRIQVLVPTYRVNDLHKIAKMMREANSAADGDTERSYKLSEAIAADSERRHREEHPNDDDAAIYAYVIGALTANLGTLITGVRKGGAEFHIERWEEATKSEV